MRRYIVGAINGSMHGTLAVYDRTKQRWYSTSVGITLFASESQAQAWADELNALDAQDTSEDHGASPTEVR